MAEVDYKSIGEEFGLGETESKEVYDEWTATTDPLTLEYPEEIFRTHVKRFINPDDEPTPVEASSSSSLGFSYDTITKAATDYAPDYPSEEEEEDMDHCVSAQFMLESAFGTSEKKQDPPKDVDELFAPSEKKVSFIVGNEFSDLSAKNRTREEDSKIGYRLRPSHPPPPSVRSEFSDDVEEIWDNPNAPQLIPSPALRPDSLNIHLDLFFERLSTTSSVRQRELERQLRRTREDIDVLNGLLVKQRGALDRIVESTYYADEAQDRSLPAVVGQAARRKAIDTQEEEINRTTGFSRELNRIAGRVSGALYAKNRSPETLDSRTTNHGPNGTSVRGIDEILASTDDYEDEEDSDFTASFDALSVSDSNEKAILDSVRDYGIEEGHARHVLSPVRRSYQEAAARAMLRTAETVARSRDGSRKFFFLVVPSEGVARKHMLCLADESKRQRFVRSHMLQQAGPVEIKSICDRPWVSLASASTEYRFPSENEETLIRTRDNDAFKLSGEEPVYHIRDDETEKNLKIVYLAPEETRRLV